MEAAEALRTSERFSLTELQKAYVNACAGLRQRQADEKERQRQQKLTIFKWAAAVAGTLLLVACGGFIWALYSRGIAKQQTAVATKAVESESQARRDEEEARKDAEKDRDNAKTQTALAQEAQAKEVKAMEKAEEQRKKAEKERDRAEWQLYASRINLAQTEWQYGTPSVAWHHLDACRWDLRGWEHDYLFTLFKQNQRSFNGHTGGVLSAAFSRDGKRIVSGSYDQTLKVWLLDRWLEKAGKSDRAEAAKGGT